MGIQRCFRAGETAAHQQISVARSRARDACNRIPEAQQTCSAVLAASALASPHCTVGTSNSLRRDSHRRNRCPSEAKRVGGMTGRRQWAI